MRVPTPGPAVRTADGITLASWDLGGEGPPLLFLHATGFHGRCWAPLADELGPSFHCWGLDQRGHGDSDRAPDMDYAWGDFSADVAATITALELGRPYVVGHSLGGGVALLTEALAPATFREIYVYEPVVLGAYQASSTAPAAGSGEPGSNNNVLANLARRRRSRFASKAAAIDNYIRKPPFAVFRSDALAAYVDGGFRRLPEGDITLSCDTESEARVFEAASSSAIAEALVPTRTPTCLAYGDQDPMISDHDAISRTLGGAATVEEFPFLGHLGPFQDPARVARAIARRFATRRSG